MMVKKIVDFIRNKLIVDPEQGESNASQRVLIATCVLMLEMAHADNEFSSIEEERILTILKEQFDLTKEAAEAIIALSDLERKRSLDLWQFTNLINDNFFHDEKMRVIETLWRVVYADGHVDMYEEYLIRKLSNLLNMKHKDLIQAKFNARQSHIKSGRKP
jgi:uncharacterized tellurite resistance protein B-like protein